MLEDTDKEIYDLIRLESERQIGSIELIASENYVSKAVLEAMGSVLTNKYSEGLPGKRYYRGNVEIDKIERLAIERAKELFKAEHVNVQPYSGSPANFAVHLAFLNPGDRTMGMSLDAGGHLTHGSKISVSGRYFKSISYGVNSEGYIDYDNVREIAKKYRPKLIWAGFSAYSRIIDWREFREIADEINAVLAIDIAHIAGLVVTGDYPTPVPYADVVTTTTHKTLRGPRGAIIMCKEQYAEAIDKAVFPGVQGGPHNNITAAVAVALKEASQSEFKKYIEQVIRNAKRLADSLKKKGYKIISGGTDNHLMLVDTIESAGISGKEAALALEKVDIILNKNAIPNDPRKPWDPSGVRIGTPAVTTRGMKESEMDKIVELIDIVLKNYEDENIIADVKTKVKDLIKTFPVPGIQI